MGRHDLEHYLVPRNQRHDITVERVLELYHNNYLVKDIAKTLNCCVVTVRKRLRIVGIGKNELYSRSMKLDWRGTKVKEVMPTKKHN